MKKSFLLALAVTGLLLTATTSTFAQEKEVTIKGEGQCAKCSLSKTDACQNAIVVKENGKEITYFLTKNDVSNKFHKEICKGIKPVQAKGTVKEVDGKKEFTAKQIELVAK